MLLWIYMILLLCTINHLCKAAYKVGYCAFGGTDPTKARFEVALKRWMYAVRYGRSDSQIWMQNHRTIMIRVSASADNLRFQADRTTDKPFSTKLEGRSYVISVDRQQVLDKGDIPIVEAIVACRGAILIGEDHSYAE